MQLIITKDSVIISHWELIENTGKLPQAQVTKPRLVVILHLIGWENGASFRAQSQREVKQKLM